jgi:hypothetical protein
LRNTVAAEVEGSSGVRLIGWLCVMGISLMCGLLSGHFAPHRSRSYHRRNDFEAFLRETAPGLIPNAVIAASLLALDS